MHSNNFVLAIKDNNGKSLRENRSGEVFLPFGSEYKLHLKNNNWQRALIKVSIDGTDVTGPGIVLNGQGSIDLERFLIDGNLKGGRKFKFVSVDDPAVADPGSSENGIVKVQFQLEKLVPWTITTTYIPRFVPPIEYLPYDSYKPVWMDPSSTGGVTRCCSTTVTPKESVTQTMYSAQMATSPSQAGATVEGGQSSQSFGTVMLDEMEAVTTTLMLRLLAPAGVVSPVTSSETKKVHCSSCNSKVRWDDAFCWKCGNKLVHQEMVRE